MLQVLFNVFLKFSTMKKILLLLITFYFVEAKAQNNFQWADSGAVWHHTYNWIGLPGYQKTTYIGDTILNNQTCQILFSEGQQAWPQPSGPPIVGTIQGVNTCYLFKSNDSVFTYRNNNFHLAFKTNATVGEIWDLGDFGYITNSHAYVKVDSVYYQNYNGVSLRNIHVFPCKQNGDSIELGLGLIDTNYISKLNTINEKFGPLGSFQTINNATPNNIIDESLDQSILCYQSASFPFIQFNPSDCFNNLFVGIDDQVEDAIQIYPNPAQNELFINNAPANTHIQFYNLQGQVVLNKALQKASVNIEELQNGLYLYRIFDVNNGAILTGKVIKD
jgi:hypothetical protein